ncbi:MAG: winged helix-turn-helix transcriptional regulator [Clostridia bacterium]|nr:winged helix-turn-helix transcriptional regulator [Clostridia bacterium]
MKKNPNPTAAAVFSDRTYREMLENELLHANFDISDEKYADLLLTETEFLPFVSEKKHIIAFLPEEELPEGKMKADAVLPHVFSLAELEKELKRIYFEILFSSEKPKSAEKKRENEKDDITVSVLPDGKNALVGGEKITLSANEWTMLDLLCKAAERGDGVSREELGSAMGHDADECGNIVDVYICHLRRKIEMPLGRRLIFTVRGFGYSLIKRKTEDKK